MVGEGGGGGHYALLSSKICLLRSFGKPNKTVDLCFIPVLHVCFRRLQLTGQAGCLQT